MLKRLLLAVVLFSTAAFAQEPAAKPAQEAAKPAVVPAKIPAELHEPTLEVQLLATQKALAESQYANALATLDKLQKDYADLTTKLNAKLDEFYSKLGISKNDWDVNFSTGDITPKKK